MIEPAGEPRRSGTGTTARSDGVPLLVLGPVLRHVDETTATVWVQLDRAATVTVRCWAVGRLRRSPAQPKSTTRTFEVRGHHYALVSVTGLEPDTIYPYDVEVDGEVVWPPPVSPFPPSSLRTRGPASARRLRIIFGSCRYAKVPTHAAPKMAAHLGIDALDAFAAAAARLPREEWPDALLLLGDQVYADELTPQNRRRIAGRRDRHPEWPDDEIVSFDEYVGLYRDSWSDPEVRWLLSCVPVGMIFDDHDVRDDWNTSALWRAEMARKPWWRDRIRSALASYWVYQHLGNLSAAERAADPDYQAVVAHEGDAWPLLAELADRADAEVDGNKGVRFSFRWDLGATRFVMIDSRNGRILDDGPHRMLGDVEFAWIEEQVRDRSSGEVEHLVLGTSLPWLLPHAIGDLQGVNEIAAGRPGWRGWLGERIRQAGDLEHWQAFRASFDRLTRLITTAATGAGGPATVSVLSGDVHHSYAARVDLPGAETGSAVVHQLTCSPVHNVVQWFITPLFRLGWSASLARMTGRLAARTGVPPVDVTWRKLVGPLFGNTIATLEIDGRRATVAFAQPRSAGSVVEVARLELAAGPSAEGSGGEAGERRFTAETSAGRSHAE
jgi:phosphodiesterase/alkaline phosphatase D-like protein